MSTDPFIHNADGNALPEQPVIQTLAVTVGVTPRAPTKLDGGEE